MNTDRTGGSAVLTAILIALAVVALVGAFLGTAAYTDRPGFCKTCHEMTPYYTAWSAGPHNEVWCVDCHVEPGFSARLAHKFVALGEVRSHFLGDTSFPRPEAPDVPDARCLSCHPEPGPDDPDEGFSHAEHRKYGSCQSCHASTGHDVTDAALREAGVFDAASAQRRRVTIAAGKVAAPGAGSANLTGHPRVGCSGCHDMKATGCKACHAPPTDEHPKDDTCTRCHTPSGEWAFNHPARGDCGSCHTPPKNHFGPDCASCHTPGADFEDASFDHPSIPGGEHTSRSFPCVKCHPQGPPTPSCTCHGGGIFQDD